MRPRNRRRVGLAVLGAIALASCGLALVQTLQVRTQREDLVEKQQQWATALSDLAEVRSQLATHETHRSEQAQRLADLTAELAELRNPPASETNVPPDPSRPPVRPLPARIFHGQQFVGFGWVAVPPTNGAAGAAAPATVVLSQAATSPASPLNTATPTPPGSGSAAYSYATFWQQSYPYWPAGWLVVPGGLVYDPDHPQRHPDSAPPPPPQPTTPLEPVAPSTPWPVNAGVQSRPTTVRPLPHQVRPAPAVPTSRPMPSPPVKAWAASSRGAVAPAATIRPNLATTVAPRTPTPRLPTPTPRVRIAR